MHFGSGIGPTTRSDSAASNLRAEVDEFQGSYCSPLNMRQWEFQNLNTAKCNIHI